MKQVIELFKLSKSKEQLITDVITDFHTILKDNDQLVEAFRIRSSLKKNKEVFPAENDDCTIDEIHTALNAIDKDDKTIYSRHDEHRPNVIVDDASFVRFRQHMKLSDALIYDAAAFTATANCMNRNAPKQPKQGERVELPDEETIVEQRQLQQDILDALTFEILKLEYQQKAAPIQLLIAEPSIPERIKVRAALLIQQPWDEKIQGKTLDALHDEMILIKNEWDIIDQQMQALEEAYLTEKNRLIARLRTPLAAEARTIGVRALQQIRDAEVKQNVSLIYHELREIVLNASTAMNTATQRHVEFSENQLRNTLNEPGLLPEQKKSIETALSEFEKNKNTTSLDILSGRATELLELKSSIQKEINVQDRLAYQEMLKNSKELLKNNHITPTNRAWLETKIKEENGNRSVSDKLRSLAPAYKETKKQVDKRSSQASGEFNSLSRRPTITPVTTQPTFFKDPPKQHQDKSILRGLGLVFLGGTILSLTVLSAIATFGAGSFLPALALPFCLSLAVSGITVLGLAGIGVAAKGGFDLSR